MQLDEFIDRALAVPFLEKGRSWSGWDCWGVVYMAYNEVLDIELPQYTGEYSSSIRRDELRNLIERRKDAEWSNVDDPIAMDFVLLKMLGRDCHIGLMIDAKNFLHVEAKCMTHIESVNDIAWRGAGYDKVEGFYRHALSA